MADLEKLKNVSLSVVQAVKESKGHVADLMLELELNHHEWEFTREEVRMLIKSHVIETELDMDARNPTTNDPTMGAIDRALRIEVVRLTQRVEQISEIAALPPGRTCTFPDGEEIRPEDARKELASLRNTLMEMKRGMVDQKKAEQALVDVSVNVDLGSIMGDALENIKNMELPVEARIIEVE